VLHATTPWTSTPHIHAASGRESGNDFNLAAADAETASSSTCTETSVKLASNRR
jgi:hypothetical protein